MVNFNFGKACTVARPVGHDFATIFFRKKNRHPPGPAPPSPVSTSLQLRLPCGVPTGTARHATNGTEGRC